MTGDALRGVLILAGATCSGKTALALDLAERFDAEIVGADSRQIYAGMAIGTAAPSNADLARVPHHLIGFLDPRERYSAARYAADALAAIRAIQARGKRAIVVGGTGFYVRALAGDVRLSGAYDEALHAWLAARDPERAAAVKPGDRYRVARALEIALAPRAPASAREPEHASLREDGVPYLKIALDVAQVEIDARISARVKTMLDAGLVAEAERIGIDAVAADAVGYPQAFAYLAGWSTHAELAASLARATRRYARRQFTWFRREPDIVWRAPHDVSAVVCRTLGWRMRSEST